MASLPLMKSLAELSELYGDLQHGGSGRQRGRSVIANLRWLCRHDGRHHRNRAMVAVGQAIAERTKGGASS